MELKIGHSLEDILVNRGNRDSNYLNKYPETVLLEIFLKICDAISFAHSNNVVHLDLKPSNIQVGEYGEVIVCDWGLGKIIGSQENSSDNPHPFEPDMLNDIQNTSA